MINLKRQPIDQPPSEAKWRKDAPAEDGIYWYRSTSLAPRMIRIRGQEVLNALDHTTLPFPELTQFQPEFADLRDNSEITGHYFDGSMWADLEYPDVHMSELLKPVGSVVGRRKKSVHECQVADFVFDEDDNTQREGRSERGWFSVLDSANPDTVIEEGKSISVSYPMRFDKDTTNEGKTIWRRTR